MARTILIDTIVKKLISKYPDAICINMGCGLDNRFSRVDNGQIQWYEIDLPNSIAVRQYASLLSSFKNRENYNINSTN